MTNGEATTYSLKTGSNIFTIAVSDGMNAATSYTVTVEREQSSNTTLKSITLSSGKISLKDSVKEYDLAVENGVDTLTVTPEASDSKATVKVNDKAVKDKGVTVRLPVGKTDISIVVTAESGVQQKYTLTVTTINSYKIEEYRLTRNHISKGCSPFRGHPFIIILEFIYVKITY